MMRLRLLCLITDHHTARSRQARPLVAEDRVITDFAGARRVLANVARPPLPAAPVEWLRGDRSFDTQGLSHKQLNKACSLGHSGARRFDEVVPAEMMAAPVGRFSGTAIAEEDEGDETAGGELEVMSSGAEILKIC